MTIANTKDLEKVVDEVLRPHGFTKRRSTWHRAAEETVHVINLQKFDFGGQYCVNLGVSVRSLSEVEYPPEEKCHIRMRLDRIHAERESVLQAFDLENRNITTTDRVRQISEYVMLGDGWLNNLSSLRAIVDRLNENVSLRRRTTVALKRFLNMDPDI